MENKSHLDVLEQGVKAWNSWREQDHLVTPDLTGANLRKAELSNANLSGANLRKADLSGANLSGANLSGANLSEADLWGADLSGADLSGAILEWARLLLTDFAGADLSLAYLSAATLIGANLSGANLDGAGLSGAILEEATLIGTNLSEAHLDGANLSWARLSGADLSGANLDGANLSWARLSGADLSAANLRNCVLVKTILDGTTLTDCDIYGISAWSLSLEETKQWNLNISDYDEPDVTVDNLEVAQFVYLLLHNEKLRQVIDTITSKAVLILGRFAAERKAILDAMRDALRQRGYLPILFDFEKPTSRDLTETISTLAHMARFIIADITEAKSIPQELQAIIPDLPSVPVQPLLLASDHEYGMFEHFRRYPWVLDTYYYRDLDEVLVSLEDKIITPAENKARELST